MRNKLLKLFAVAVIIFSAIHGQMAMIFNTARNSPYDWVIVIEDLIYTVALRFALFLVGDGAAWTWSISVGISKIA